MVNIMTEKNERKVLKALLKNANYSDRRIGISSGVSQPTVTRLRTRLEDSGVILGYSIIPKLNRLGYNIMAYIFTNNAVPLKPNVISIAKGTGLGHTKCYVSVHKNYAEFSIFVKTHCHGDCSFFLVDLNAEGLVLFNYEGLAELI